MKKLMNAVLLSCRKATELVEKKRHGDVGNMEGVQLTMHLSMCRNCRNYAKQTAVIDRLLRTSTSIMDTSLLEDRIIIQLKKIG